MQTKKVDVMDKLAYFMCLQTRQLAITDTLVINYRHGGSSVCHLWLIIVYCRRTITCIRKWCRLFYFFLSAKIHYSDTGYGHVVQHHQRTSSQQLYNLLVKIHLKRPKH